MCGASTPNEDCSTSTTRQNVTKSCCARPAHLDDGERGAAGGVVDGGVQARAEEVLVVLRIEAGREQRAVLRLRALALAQHVGAQAARQLGLVLDGAVLRRTDIAVMWSHCALRPAYSRPQRA